MFPILVKIGPVTVHTYGFMMAVGVAMGLWFVYGQAKKYDLSGSRLIDMGFYTIIISLVGAKLILLVGNFSYYAKYPKELLSLARSGGVFQGGLTFGFLFAIWYLRRHKIPIWKTADLIGTALALGHGIGRLGCFAAGCCYGRACDMPWGISFGNTYAHDLTGITQGQSIHPTQLYEAVMNFVNFAILFLILKKKKFDGQVFSFYIINYSIIRFIIELYRGDHPDRAFLIQNPNPYLSLSYPQVFCLVGLVGGLILFFVLKKRRRA